MRVNIIEWFQSWLARGVSAIKNVFLKIRDGFTKAAQGAVGVSKAFVSVGGVVMKNVGVRTVDLSSVVVQRIRYYGQRIGAFFSAFWGFITQGIFHFMHRSIDMIRNARIATQKAVSMFFAATMRLGVLFFVVPVQAVRQLLTKIVQGTVRVSKAFINVSGAVVSSIGVGTLRTGKGAFNFVHYSIAQVYGFFTAIYKCFVAVGNGCRWSVRLVIEVTTEIARFLAMLCVSIFNAFGACLRWLLFSRMAYALYGILTVVTLVIVSWDEYMKQLQFLAIHRTNSNSAHIEKVLAGVEARLTTTEQQLQMIRKEVVVHHKNVESSLTQYEHKVAHVLGEQEARVAKNMGEHTELLKSEIAVRTDAINKELREHENQVNKKLVVHKKIVRNHLVQQEHVIAQKLNDQSHDVAQQIESHAQGLDEKIVLQSHQLNEIDKKLAVHEQQANENKEELSSKLTQQGQALKHVVAQHGRLINEKIAAHEQAVAGKVAVLGQSVQQNVAALDKKIEKTNKRIVTLQQTVRQVQNEQEARLDAQQKIKDAVSEQLGGLRAEIQKRKKEEKRKQVLSKLIDQLAEEQE
jgi:hypothetical protein